jgi:hypothetical protein
MARTVSPLQGTLTGAESGGAGSCEAAWAAAVSARSVCSSMGRPPDPPLVHDPRPVVKPAFDPRSVWP